MMINNMPSTARRWIVAREADGALWYWGSWNDREAAQEAAWDVGGIVVERDLAEG